MGRSAVRCCSELIMLCAALLSTGCSSSNKAHETNGLTPIEARSIAKDAYIYGVPMVAQYKTMYAYSISKSGPQYMGPFNSILNIARVFTPTDTAFVTPNSDTPYSFSGLDLRAEPAVITIPKMEKNRYFVFQLMDLYTFNFSYIGSRTTGNEGEPISSPVPNGRAMSPARSPRASVPKPS